MSASACLGLVIKTCHQNMDSTTFCSYLCIILAAMQEVVYCKQSCSSLEFPEVSGSTVHAKEHSTVSIPFHVNTKKCEMVPDLFILFMKETNGRHVNQCTIRVSTGTCTLSDTSTACRCPSTDDNMLFVKRVTASDEGVYVWRWNEKGSMSRETKITLNVSEADRELLTHHTDNQQSTTEDRHQAVDPTTSERTAHDDDDEDDDDDDAWKEHPIIGESTTVSLQHAGDLEAGAVHSVDPYIDNRVILIVTIATCVCLVVITTVITAGIVICMKARRRHHPQMNPDLNAAFANLNGALLDLNISRDQARDIYEEIPDPPKAHRTSRVSSTDNSGSSVKNPLIEVKEREEPTATQHPTKQVGSCGSFDGYLHPAGVSSELVDEKDLAPVGVLSP